MSRASLVASTLLIPGATPKSTKPITPFAFAFSARGRGSSGYEGDVHEGLAARR